MKYKESDLENYAAPIGKTEDEKCRHAIEMVRDALTPAGYAQIGNFSLQANGTGSYVLNMSRTDRLGNTRRIKLLVQGSYANKTNIPSESDVDVAVILETGFSPFVKVGNSISFTNPNQPFLDAAVLKKFKDEIEDLLRAKFRTGVSRHNKSIQIRGNTYRVDADVVPCGRYNGQVKWGEKWYSISGVRIQPDSGTAIINYPERHIVNGEKRNAESSYLFKKLVRIMKHIRANMEDCGWASAKQVSSFAIESMLWNVPVSEYAKFPSVLWYSFNTAVDWLQDNKSKIGSFWEINGIKSFDEDDPSRSRVCMAFLNELFRHYDYEHTT